MFYIAKDIHNYLLKNKKTISTAESCTGGLLCAILTELPGSSKYFILGIVSYSNAAKKNTLKIPAGVMRKNGAVSREVASLMAKNVRRLAKTDFAIGITGIAGPTGSLSQKPVGTVFIAISSKNKSICKKFIFKGNRNSIRKQAVLKAMHLLKSA